MRARSELVQEEMERVVRKAGYYITPERLAELLGRTQKVVAVLAGGRMPLSYMDCEIVLDLAGLLWPVLADWRKSNGNPLEESRFRPQLYRGGRF